MNAAMAVPAALYSRIAARRRRRALARPAERRRLDRPVVSVGNLSVGGSGKTPLVAALARLLIQAGHRPAILSRGYAREDAADGVVVVSDGTRLLADVARAGDEPLLLARSVPGAAVLVGSDRYLAGRLAEWQLGCTVHLLDDGFQHLQLARTVDLVILQADDLDAPRVLPAGRLREPLWAASHADAVLVGEGPDLARVAEWLRTPEVFRLARHAGAFQAGDPSGWTGAPPARVVAVAGIAKPAAFFAGLREAGCDVAVELAFRDHHRFERGDVDRIARAVSASGAQGVLTTGKDLMRLLPLRPWPFALAWRALDVSVEPAADFDRWLLARVPPVPVVEAVS